MILKTRYLKIIVDYISNSEQLVKKIDAQNKNAIVKATQDQELLIENIVTSLKDFLNIAAKLYSMPVIKITVNKVNNYKQLTINKIPNSENGIAFNFVKFNDCDKEIKEKILASYIDDLNTAFKEISLNHIKTRKEAAKSNRAEKLRGKKRKKPYNFTIKLKKFDISTDDFKLHFSVKPEGKKASIKIIDLKAPLAKYSENNKLKF